MNNGDDVIAEVWIGDINTGCALTNVNNLDGYLCVWLHDYTSNQTISGYWPSNNANTWPTAFNTAEAIQEWNWHGSEDYANFGVFSFIQAWDAHSDFSEQFMGISNSTFMDQIGSPSHSQGGSCMATPPTATSIGSCSDEGTVVKVWWHSYQ